MVKWTKQANIDLVAAAYAVHRDELAIGPILNAIDSNVKIDLEALHAEMQKKNYDFSKNAIRMQLRRLKDANATDDDQPSAKKGQKMTKSARRKGKAAPKAAPNSFQTVQNVSGEESEDVAKDQEVDEDYSPPDVITMPAVQHPSVEDQKVDTVVAKQEDLPAEDKEYAPPEVFNL